ncbi:MAG: methionine synthase [Planctomycetota bacterium]|nr:methionine synthase [Planctomycetota bacterium]
MPEEAPSSDHACGPGCPHRGGAPLVDERAVHDQRGYRRDERARRFPYLAALRERVLIYDGGFGTELFKFPLAPGDLGSGAQEGCVELIHRTRPEIPALIHRRYLEAGADVIETHSFNALPHCLAEFGLAEQAEALAETAARCARAAADDFATAERPRFVAGALGSGTKLPSLGHIAYRDLVESYRVGARGLIRGGVDLILIETAQDVLQVRAAVHGARLAMRDLGREVPIQAQVTIETTGTTLTGSDAAAALAALEALPVDVVGINCATGPDLMDSHIRVFAEQATRWVSCLPNAGLPRNEGGRAVYDLTPEELVRWHTRFVRDYGVNAVGGCCGTTPAHIAALARALHGATPGRPRPERAPAVVASLYQAVPLRQDPGLFLVGERTNATGSKAFRELLFAGDLDGIVQLAQEQVAEGCHALDVSVAWTGRDERADMARVIERLATAVQVPIMVDSTQPEVLEIALERLPGRAIINSVNLEDGEEKLDRVCELARRHGAAVVALTIDEDREAGMAKTVERKIAVAERLHRLITERHGIPPERILFDLLTFPITQGDEDTRKLALWTLEGIAAVRARFPEAGCILGVSNVSFGLKPYARQVLNSVFLHEAIQRGLTAAIVHAAKILPLDRLSAEELALARDLIYDRRQFADGVCVHDPLLAFVQRFAASAGPAASGAAAQLTLEERLVRHIVEGRRAGLEATLDEALTRYPPLDIINRFLLAGMKEVGDLFGAGKMQLPFVLQAAETMKAAVKYLEPRMERVGGAHKGTMVLATVRGDVHDIGKNLVDIILSNNGYRVINLGIKQPIEAIAEAVERYRPDAVGMSGLLVKSTVVMKENLEWLAARGYRVPVICGGAALTRAYVEHDLRAAYRAGQRARDDCQVYYAADAFDGLQLMDELCGQVPPERCRLTTRQPRPRLRPSAYEVLEAKLRAGEQYVPSQVPPAPRIPEPPFWGRRLVGPEELDLATIAQYLNRNALFRGQWGFRQGQQLSRAEWEELVRREAEPVFHRLIAEAERGRRLAPAVAYGYWPAASERNDLLIFDPESGEEVARLRLPRQSEPGSRRLCIADFFRPRHAAPLGDEQRFLPPAAWREGARDVLAVQVVTMGEAASRWTAELFARDSYQEYLYAHGFSVEMAEALAEYWHKRVRQQLGIAGADALEIAELFTQGYQGSRYSFGYPACPRLEDQAVLERLLRWQDIGIRLSEEWQLVPEQSTSCIIVHHPEARYFDL